MQATTDSEIRSQIPGCRPRGDSPAVHARARARITDTKREVKPKSTKTWNVSASLSDWASWTAKPASFQDTWAASAVDRDRIPAASTGLLWAWRISNWTDRLVMFGLICTLPTALTGPLRWCAARPTRRYGLYLVVAAFTAAVWIGGI